jgi:uncharacterized membrane protein
MLPEQPSQRIQSQVAQDATPPGFLTTGRVEAFSDGVFAVAITLLVLNLQLPANPGSLPAILLHLWPKFLIYALSFVIVGIYWVGHHNTFHYIQRTDRILLWLNILLLLFIVFIPFPTALVGEYGITGTYPDAQIAIGMYGGTLIATGCVLETLWLYATHHHRLVEHTIDPQLVQRATRRNLMGPSIYLVAIGLSFLPFLGPWISLLCFILVPVLYIMPGRIDIHWTPRHLHKIEDAPAQKPYKDARRITGE